MGLELAMGALAGATLRLNEIHEHPFLPYGIFAEHTHNKLQPDFAETRIPDDLAQNT
jgi:hypothetical protein